MTPRSQSARIAYADFPDKSLIRQRPLGGQSAPAEPRIFTSVKSLVAGLASAFLGIFILPDVYGIISVYLADHIESSEFLIGQVGNYMRLRAYIHYHVVSTDLYERDERSVTLYSLYIIFLQQMII